MTAQPCPRCQAIGFTWAIDEGVQYFMSPRFALDMGAGLGFGKLGTVKLNGQRIPEVRAKNSTTPRVLFGVNWYL